MRPLQVPSFHTIIAADARRLPQDYPPSVSSGAAATTDTGHHKSPRSSRLAGTNYRYIIGPLTIKLFAEAHPVVSMRGSETHSGPETRISPRMALTSRPEARLKIDVNKMSRSLAEDHRIQQFEAGAGLPAAGRRTQGHREQPQCHSHGNHLRARHPETGARIAPGCQSRTALGFLALRAGHRLPGQRGTCPAAGTQAIRIIERQHPAPTLSGSIPARIPLRAHGKGAVDYFIKPWPRHSKPVQKENVSPSRSNLDADLDDRLPGRSAVLRRR